MKQYRHKPTGNIAEERYVWDNPTSIPIGRYYCVKGKPENIPTYCVESGSDWEEIKPEPEVPPGIVSFNADGQILKLDENKVTYNDWVRYGQYLKHTIHSIKVNDTIWEVGDIVDVNLGNWSFYTSTIESFYYENGNWRARGKTCFQEPFNVSVSDHIKKTLKKKPICSLQGKDMYEGDTYYWVNKPGWDIGIGKIEKEQPGIWTYNKELAFSTKELAEAHVRDNKPVYPAGLVDPLINLQYHNNEYLVWINKLKAFKTK